MYPESFKRKPSKKTPLVILEPGKIFIMGRSIPENPGEFFQQVYDWIFKYRLDYKGTTKIALGFEYINTSSAKWIYFILKEVAELHELTQTGMIKWYYEKGDEDMCELGFILRSLVNCSFEIIEVDEMNNSRYEKLLSSDF
jgi:hypothetical protein